jgi:hypothetical protein
MNEKISFQIHLADICKTPVHRLLNKMSKDRLKDILARQKQYQANFISLRYPKDIMFY